jgi:hypothetical protein
VAPNAVVTEITAAKSTQHDPTHYWQDQSEFHWAIPTPILPMET